MSRFQNETYRTVTEADRKTREAILHYAIFEQVKKYNLIPGAFNERLYNGVSKVTSSVSLTLTHSTNVPQPYIKAMLTCYLQEDGHPEESVMVEENFPVGQVVNGEESNAIEELVKRFQRMLCAQDLYAKDMRMYSLEVQSHRLGFRMDHKGSWFTLTDDQGATKACSWLTWGQRNILDDRMKCLEKLKTDLPELNERMMCLVKATGRPLELFLLESCDATVVPAVLVFKVGSTFGAIQLGDYCNTYIITMDGTQTLYGDTLIDIERCIYSGLLGEFNLRPKPWWKRFSTSKPTPPTHLTMIYNLTNNAK